MHTLRFFLRATLIPGLALFGLTLALSAAPPSFAAERILVKPHDHLSEIAIHALLAAHGVDEIDSIPQLNVRIAAVPAQRLDRVLEALSRNPNIEYAERDPVAYALLTPNDPLYGDQWHLPKINAPLAWDMTTGNTNAVIAILDTGIAYGHPDLQGKVLQGYNFISNNTDASDDHGHGTLVAGAAAAISDNGAGVAGVAWKNHILPVKVLDANGSGNHSTIANGITYAADSGARIINLSLGSASGSRTLERAVNYAWKQNAVLIAAAGNNGTDSPVYPAAYANVVGVSALTSNDSLATFSSWGSHVSISAPGVSILTTRRNGTYGNASGTSLASPLVAGVAGLVLSVTPQLKNSEIRDILESTATDLGSAGYDVYYGHGRVDAHGAVQAAGGAPTEDTTAPFVQISSPGSGTTVAGTIEVLVDATDDVGVTRVELYINESLYAYTDADSVAFVWDTTTSKDGDYVLDACAYDAAGNIGISARVSVKVANNVVADTTPPAVTILSPSDGTTVVRNVKIDIAATDNVGVERIELYINGQLHGTSSGDSASFNWNTNRVPRGEYRLQAYAYDAAGNVGTTAITVYK